MNQVGRAHLGHERESESDLLLRVRSGDMDAFTELAERNSGPALAIARGIVDPATAEDVVADSLERLLVVLRRGEGPTYSVRPYFLQMVRNRAIDYQRRNREIPTDAPVPLPPTPQMPDEADTDVVRSAFEALPERWQTALWLGVVESRSHAEIGKELDVGETAASQLLYRAREGLRQSYLDAQVGQGEGCDRLSGMLGKYVRERTSRRDAHKVNQHLSECPQCRAAVAKTRDLNARIGSVLAVSVLGGVGMELFRRPGMAFAAESAGGPARMAQAAKQSSTARHVVSAVAGVAATVALVLAMPVNGSGVLADAIMSVPPPVTPTPSLPSLSPSPRLSPTPKVRRPTAPASSASPSKGAVSSSPKPSPSPTPSPIDRETPEPPPSPTPTDPAPEGEPTVFGS